MVRNERDPQGRYRNARSAYVDGLAAESFGVYTAAVSVISVMRPVTRLNTEVTERSIQRAQRGISV